MARKSRIEVEGGLHHLITRGNDRRDIFHSRMDHEKFIQLLMTQKQRLPFYLYAYCLMTNRIHLLIERRADDIGRIMHRVLSLPRRENVVAASLALIGKTIADMF